MKWSFASVGLIVFGLIGITIILLFEQLTTTNENDYYLLKEISEAAMFDAIDITYYRETGDLKIIKEKFVENFTRRFAESTLLTGTGYTINFYNIMETPPKVTVEVNTGLGQYKIFEDTSSYNIQNVLSGILEYTGKYTNVSSGDIHYNNPYIKKTYTKTYYSLPYSSDKINFGVKQPLNIPEELKKNNIKNIQIENITVDGVVTSQGELLLAKLNREIDWAKATENVDTEFLTTINDYVKNLTVNNTEYYNCEARTGTLSDIDCENYKYWLYWSGTSTDNKNNVALKLNVTWSYDKYEFID